ncbi:MAG TPA: alpha/beta fold hydrolase [Anaeromyxobacteraceae bacterium]|nr:alpha/beta fold hydrolase [Anaeromyxobacteraceae bacterium]
MTQRTPTRLRLSPGPLDATLSALNAVLGDYLRNRANPLDLGFSLYHQNEPLACRRDSIAAAYPAASRKVCVLVHGLAMNEGCWAFPEDRQVSYGSLLEKDRGYTPLFVRYNSGLHISENGKSLSDTLAELVSCYPGPVEELVLIGHSVGGLVVRSACEVARTAGEPWLDRVAHAFYIGSPHRGTSLERLGNVTTWVLKRIGDPHTKMVAKVLNLRSAGIKDLRFASLMADDWAGRDPDALLQNACAGVPLVEGPSHHFLVGTLGPSETDVLTRIFGDAMVSVASAGGPRQDAGRLTSARETVRLFPGVSHVALMHHPDVYAWIATCCSARHDPAEAQ